jgi:hypothetical protein
MKPSNKVACDAIEKARRPPSDYQLMQRLADDLIRKAELEEKRERGEILCRIYYELHMAAQQQAETSSGRMRRSFLQKSLKLAERSAKEGEDVGHTIGVLYAYMNISGRICPMLGRRNALALSTQTSERAEAIANSSQTTEQDRVHAWRIARNCYVHRMRILMEQRGNPIAVAELLQKMDNPAITSLSDHYELEPDLQQARLYVAV